jgi:hypothetical protein
VEDGQRVGSKDLSGIMRYLLWLLNKKMYLYIGISTYESERTLDSMIEPTFNHPISGGQEPH